jgi:hypothetical protein
MSTAVNALRRALRKDDKWARFMAIRKAAYAPEFEKYIEEIQRMHKTRSIRVLGATAAPTGKKIADAAMRDQSVRSRCVEICMEITRNRNQLAIAMNTVSTYVNAEYGSLLADNGVRAVTERRSIVESLFGPAQRTLDELDTITEIADLVIKDVDQASWSIKSTVTALEVATARERS